MCGCKGKSTLSLLKTVNYVYVDGGNVILEYMRPSAGITRIVTSSGTYYTVGSSIIYVITTQTEANELLTKVKNGVQLFQMAENVTFTLGEGIQIL